DVVAASGFQRAPRRPAFARFLPQGVAGPHAGEYRDPAALPPGGVVVVGGGQSGVQIAEDLREAGRRVYLCTSRVGRTPRRYRGRDLPAWWHELGLLDVRPDEVEPSALRAALPQVTGAGGGRTVALQQLARDGVTLLGRARGIHGGRLVLA